MKKLILLVLLVTSTGIRAATVLSVSGNWAVETWTSGSSVSTSEIARVGTYNNSSLVKTGEAVFVFDLSGYSATDITSAVISIYGGTSSSLPLSANVDLYGLPDFTSPATTSDGLYQGNTSAQMLKENVFVATAGYSTGSYVLSSAASITLQFIRSELNAGNTQIAFRLTPDEITVPNGSTAPFFVYQDLFNGNAALQANAPKMTITAVPEPSTAVLLGIAGLILVQRSLRRRE